jgi:hypothetical protein
MNLFVGSFKPPVLATLFGGFVSTGEEGGVGRVIEELFY